MILFKLFIKRLILVALLLPLIVIPALYFTIQTKQGATWISHWLSNSNNNYQISVDKIIHSFTTPLQLEIKHLRVKRNGNEIINVESAMAAFNPNLFDDPNWLGHLQLQNGTVYIKNSSLTTLPLSSDWLLLKEIDLTVSTTKGDVFFQQVNAGISPWTPNDTVNYDSIFRLSALKFSMNQYAGEHLLILGRMKKGSFIIDAFGADLPHGDITGQVYKVKKGPWVINNLYLNHFRWQGSESLSDIYQWFSDLPPIEIKQLNIINASLEGNEWAFNDANLSLKNIKWQDGNWLAENEDSNAKFSAESTVFRELHIDDPIVKLKLNNRDIEIQQINARWQGGLIRVDGTWKNNELTLGNVIVSGIEYTLPANWRSLLHYQFPEWLQTLNINHLTSNRNVIVDVNDSFPFQLTLLDINGNDLHLIDHHRFNLWQGELSAYAHNATFNKVDLRYPAMTLRGNREQIDFAKVSAFISNGLIDGQLIVSQMNNQNFSLKLTGHNVPVDLLNHWGWQPSPMKGDGNIEFKLSQQEGEPSLTGQLEATNNQGQKILQIIPQREIREEDTAAKNTDDAEAQNLLVQSQVQE